MTANSAKASLPSLQTTFRSISLAILTSEAGVACEISEQAESRNELAVQRIGQKRHAYETLLCGLREASFGCKNGLRSSLTSNLTTLMLYGQCNQFVLAVANVFQISVSVTLNY